MKGIVLEEPRVFRVRDFPPPPPPEFDHVQVRVQRIGICGTDLHAYQGRQTFFEYPRVIGHELAVEVVETGRGVRHLEQGDRCTVEPYLNCGDCIACRKGKPNCCARLKVLGVHVDGGMRGVLNVPAAKLHRSKSLSLEELALVEMFCVGLHAVRRASLEAGEGVLVVGAGPIGLSVVESARLAGAEPLLMEISPVRMQLGQERARMANVIDARLGAMDQIRNRTGGDLPTAIFDCTGNAQSMTNSFGLVPHGGRLVLVGHYPGDITFRDPEFHGKEMTLMASRNATPQDFRDVVRLLESRAVDVKSWVTHRIAPDELGESLSKWLDPAAGVLKSVVLWSEP